MAGRGLRSRLTGAVGRLRAVATSTTAAAQETAKETGSAVRRRAPWLDHLVRAGLRYTDRNGDYLAAGITYFSFLSLFPVLLLALSVAGFVLNRDPALQHRLNTFIAEQIPGQLGASVVTALDGAIASRGAVGVVGLLGLAYAGTGWIGNLRTAFRLTWSGDRSRAGNLIRHRLEDLLVLAGLGVISLASLLLTAGTSAATGWLQQSLGLPDSTPVAVATTAIGIAVGITGDTLVFGWLFVRLPRVAARPREVLRGALFGAVGFELLKQLGAIYAQLLSRSAVAGVFGSAIGLLVWLNLVARFLIFAVAWTATGRESDGGAAAASPPA